VEDFTRRKSGRLHTTLRVRYDPDAREIACILAAAGDPEGGDLTRAAAARLIRSTLREGGADGYSLWHEGREGADAVYLWGWAVGQVHRLWPVTVDEVSAEAYDWLVKRPGRGAGG
jgi:hypothetical protein